MAETNVIIGLDIDEKSIKLAKIKQSDNEVVLLKYAVREIPPLEDKIKATSEIIKELFKDEKGDVPVYTCAYGANLSLKRVLVPIMPDDELAQALKWEAKNIIPFAIDNAAIDYYKIGQFSDKNVEKMDIMFAAAAEELMNYMNTLSKETSVKFSGISVAPFALYSLLSHNKKIEKNKVVAIIDIGAEAASINLLKGDTLQFTREISVAGDSFTKAMTGLLVADHWQLNFSYEQAEEIKKKFGIPDKDTKETTETGVPLIHIYEMIAPTLRRLQNEIQRSFDYYKEEFREEKIDHIFLTGGSSKLKNIDKHLSSALGIKVETIDPVEMIKIDPSSGIKAEELNNVSSRLCLAIGLALDRAKKINLQKIKEKQKKPSRINLDDFLRKYNIHVKVPANTAIWAAALVVLIAISYNIYLANQKNQIKKMLASKQAILSDVKALIERRVILDQIAKEETYIRETLSQITRALPSGVLLTDLVYDNTKKQVWLSGEARDTKTVGKLIKAFEDSPNFKKTVLIEARKAIIEDIQKVVFKITFNLT